MTVRLLLADDQELVRTALGALLELEEDFEVVASVGRGDEVVEAATKHQPDVALLDIEMPGLDGLSVAAVLAAQVPSCRSVILTTFGRVGYLRRAMEAGAVGFVVKDAPAEALGDTIRRVMAGERCRRSGPRCVGPGGRRLATDPQRARCPDRHPHRGERRRDRPQALSLRRDRYGTTSLPPSPRPGRATARTHSASPNSRGGCNGGGSNQCRADRISSLMSSPAAVENRRGAQRVAGLPFIVLRRRPARKRLYETVTT